MMVKQWAGPRHPGWMLNYAYDIVFGSLVRPNCLPACLKVPFGRLLATSRRRQRPAVRVVPTDTSHSLADWMRPIKSLNLLPSIILTPSEIAARRRQTLLCGGTAAAESRLGRTV